MITGRYGAGRRIRHVKKIACAILLAASVRAQTLSVEQSYGPYVRPDRGIDHSVASARSGALLAWSEIDTDGYARIHIGLLDDHAQLISPITILPAEAGDRHDFAPSVATDGTSFFVAWVERIRGRDLQLMGVPVDARGSAGAPRTYGSVANVALTPVSSEVIWDGASYQVSGAANAFTIARDGTLLGTSNRKTGSVMNPETGVVASATITTKPIFGPPGCSFFHCRQTNTEYDLVWTAGPKTGTFFIGYDDPVSAPAIAVSGDRFVIAWTTAHGAGYFVTGDGGNHVWGEADITVKPGLDCDDEKCVLAYGSTSGDVHALAFPVAQLFGPAMLPIAATERLERAPQVRALGGQRFLVSYRSDDGGQRLNGRVVAFPSSKRRSTR
jgi:hypothetical protein